MSTQWQVTDRLAVLIADLSKQAGVGAPGVPFAPSIMWSFGGTMNRAGEPTRPIPARYALGWVEQDALHKFKTISDARLETVVFHPKAEDEASSHRLIDYDGTDIIVR